MPIHVDAEYVKAYSYSCVPGRNGHWNLGLSPTRTTVVAGILGPKEVSPRDHDEYQCCEALHHKSVL